MHTNDGLTPMQHKTEAARQARQANAAARKKEEAVLFLRESGYRVSPPPPEEDHPDRERAAQAVLLGLIATLEAHGYTVIAPPG